MRPNIETLDLRGLLCPLTWARTKYALSKLAAGGELKVIVDHRPAVPDIKRNAEEIGDEVPGGDHGSGYHDRRRNGRPRGRRGLVAGGRRRLGILFGRDAQGR